MRVCVLPRRISPVLSAHSQLDHGGFWLDVLGACGKPGLGALDEFVGGLGAGWIRILLGWVNDGGLEQFRRIWQQYPHQRLYCSREYVCPKSGFQHGPRTHLDEIWRKPSFAH